MPWWGWVAAIALYLGIVYCVCEFLGVCAEARKAGDKAAAEYFGYEYKEKG